MMLTFWNISRGKRVTWMSVIISTKILTASLSEVTVSKPISLETNKPPQFHVIPYFLSNPLNLRLVGLTVFPSTLFSNTVKFYLPLKKLCPDDYIL
jgi:hypothetical protein